MVIEDNVIKGTWENNDVSKIHVQIVVLRKCIQFDKLHINYILIFICLNKGNKIFPFIANLSQSERWIYCSFNKIVMVYIFYLFHFSVFTIQHSNIIEHARKNIDINKSTFSLKNIFKSSLFGSAKCNCQCNKHTSTVSQ